MSQYVRHEMVKHANGVYKHKAKHIMTSTPWETVEKKFNDLDNNILPLKADKILDPVENNILIQDKNWNLKDLWLSNDDLVHMSWNETIWWTKTFSNDIIVSWDVHINWTATAVDSNNLTVKDNVIELNKWETAAWVTAWTAWISIDRWTENKAKFIFDEDDDKFKFDQWDWNNLRILEENDKTDLQQSINTKQNILSEWSFIDWDKNKLDWIEDSATADQTDAEIKTAYENNDDTNAYTNAEQTKVWNVPGDTNTELWKKSDKVVNWTEDAILLQDNNWNLKDSWVKDSDLVHTAWDETINWSKTFSDNLIVNADIKGSTLTMWWIQLRSWNEIDGTNWSRDLYFWYRNTNSLNFYTWWENEIWTRRMTILNDWEVVVDNNLRVWNWADGSKLVMQRWSDKYRWEMWNDNWNNLVLSAINNDDTVREQNALYFDDWSWNNNTKLWIWTNTPTEKLDIFWWLWIKRISDDATISWLDYDANTLSTRLWTRNKDIVFSTKDWDRNSSELRIKDWWKVEINWVNYVEMWLFWITSASRDNAINNNSERLAFEDHVSWKVNNTAVFEKRTTWTNWIIIKKKWQVTITVEHNIITTWDTWYATLAIRKNWDNNTIIYSLMKNSNWERDSIWWTASFDVEANDYIDFKIWAKDIINLDQNYWGAYNFIFVSN